MFFNLMHKNIVTATLDINDSGKIDHISIEEKNKAHLPLGCQQNPITFRNWWSDRAIPSSRTGARHALQELGYPSTDSLLLDNLALSLTDCYWIKPVSSDIRWEDVNLFKNPFRDIFGELTFDTTKKIDLKNKTLFKQVSSQGELQKKWCIDDKDRRFLVKGNYGLSYQQSINEAVASKLHELQKFTNYTPYDLIKIDVEGGDQGLGCFSYNFCNEEVESISAWEVLHTQPFKGSDSYYYKLVSICEGLGLKKDDIERFLQYEIMTDYLMTNTDRHFNNIQVLRNPDTLEYIGFAPIFDTGNSMFFRQANIPTGNFSKIETHSFLKHEVQMLKYIKDRSLVDTTKLPDTEYLGFMYSLDVPERHLRINDLISAFEQKVYLCEKFQKGQDIWKPQKSIYISQQLRDERQ